MEFYKNSIKKNLEKCNNVNKEKFHSSKNPFDKRKNLSDNNFSNTHKNIDDRKSSNDFVENSKKIQEINKSKSLKNADNRSREIELDQIEGNKIFLMG